MNRYSKTQLRQGRLPRQPRPEPGPEPVPEPEPPPVPTAKDAGVLHEEQALLFDLSDDAIVSRSPPRPR